MHLARQRLGIEGFVQQGDAGWQRRRAHGAVSVSRHEDNADARAPGAHLGYSVLTAAGAEEALRLSDQHEGTIDLLLTDVIMPRVSGLATSAGRPPPPVTPQRAGQRTPAPWHARWTISPWRRGLEPVLEHPAEIDATAGAEQAPLDLPEAAAAAKTACTRSRVSRQWRKAAISSASGSRVVSSSLTLSSPRGDGTPVRTWSHAAKVMPPSSAPSS